MSKFSDFIRNASSEEKERVYTDVMKKATERQMSDAARDWYAAASPYATPEALKEALERRDKALAMSERLKTAALTIGIMLLIWPWLMTIKLPIWHHYWRFVWWVVGAE